MKTAARTIVALLLLASLVRADLLVSSYNTGRVLRFNEHTGQFIDQFVGTLNGGLNLPHGLAFGPDGNLYVASAGNDSVLRYNGTNGAFLSIFITNGTGGLDYPVWLQFRGGSLYVSSQLGNEVLRYNATNGAFLGALVSSNANGGLNGPSGMTWGPDGHLYVVGRFGNQVLRYDGTNGSYLGSFVSGPAGLSQPFGLHFGPDGNLYVASGNNARIARLNGTNGNYLDDFVYNTNNAGLSLPIGLEFGPAGDLFVASFNNNKIAHFAADGSPLPDFVSSGQNGLFGPNFMLLHHFEPRIDSIRRIGTNFVIRWLGRPDTQLQSRTDLKGNNWLNVTGTVGQSAATNGLGTNTVFHRLIRD